MQGSFMVQSFLTDEVCTAADASGLFDSKTMKVIYSLSDSLGLSVGDASLLAIACSLKRLEDVLKGKADNE